MNKFQDPSPGFAVVMGMWNKRISLDYGSSADKDDRSSSKGKPHKLALSGRRRKDMRPSTQSRRQQLIKPQESEKKIASNLTLRTLKKRESAEKWQDILTTTNNLVKVKRVFKNRAAKVRLQQVIAQKLDDEPFVAPVHEKSKEDLQLIRDAILSNFVFSDLGPHDIDTLIDAFESKSFNKGDIICRKGEPGDYFYIMSSGEIDFYTTEEDHIGTAKRGNAFGGVALLYSSPCAATAVVLEDAYVFRVSQMTFRKMLRARTEHLDRQKLELLETVTAFKDVDEADLKRLTEAMVATVYEEGDILHHNDEANPPFCIVQGGELIISHGTVGSDSFNQVRLGQGEHVGVKSLQQGHNYGASNPAASSNAEGQTRGGGLMTAASSGVAYTIDCATFQKLFGNLSRLVFKAIDKKKLALIPVLAQAKLSDHALDSLAQHVEDETYKPRWKIFVKGKDTEASLYMIREGKVLLTDKEGSDDIILGPGDFFGEEQLLADTKLSTRPDFSVSPHVLPTYTVIAVETTVLGILHLDECRAVMDTTKLGTGEETGTKETYTTIPESGPDDDDEIKEDAEVESLAKHISLSTQLDELVRHQRLGEGQFGEVWLVTTTVEGSPPMALKIQKKDSFGDDAVVDVESEIALMKHLHHPFIVHLIASFEDEHYIYILMPAAPGGELFDIIFQVDENGNQKSGVDEEGSRFYSAVVADAIAYLHRRRILYRDLKPENILVDGGGYPMLIDFGISKQLENSEDKTYTFVGTPQYVAPEIILNRGHGLSSDNWALGVLMYTLLEGANPFYYEGCDQATLYSEICSGKYYPMSERVSTEAKSIVDLLLVKEPGSRLGAFRFKDIFKHPWLAPINLSELRRKKIKAPWVPDPIELE